MGVVASFSYAEWIVRYPEFSSVNPDQAAAFWNEATVYCRNDGGGPVSDLNTQTTLLNTLTAHIAFLAVGTGATQQPVALAGRISNATQGSVSVSTDLPALPGTAAYFSQSPYGLSYWAMTAQFRSFRYRAPMRGFR